jgi:hypothetical protein
VVINHFLLKEAEISQQTFFFGELFFSLFLLSPVNRKSLAIKNQAGSHT